MTDQKWRSPTGHPIPSHETDNLPPKGDKLNDVQAALDDIFLTICTTVTLPDGKECQQGRITLEQYNTIRNALAQQQENAEHIESIKQPDGSLHDPLNFIEWSQDEEKAQLDGFFTAEELISIGNYMIETPAPQMINPERNKIMKLTDEKIKYMVNRFLGWKLPKTFNPDGGVKFEPIINAGTTYEHRYEPSGTNIFCYSQAEEMVNFMLDGLPEPTPAPTETLATESEQLRKENEELKAKLDKAKDTLGVYSRSDFGHLARKTLEEI